MTARSLLVQIVIVCFAAAAAAVNLADTPKPECLVLHCFLLPLLLLEQ